MMNEEEKKPSVMVPLDKLSEDALTGLINEFILREGTDYGQREYSLDEKHAQIHKQLASGQIVIVFDPNEESVSIIRKEDISADMKE